MKNALAVGIFCFFIIGAVYDIGQAQLINYGRQSKFLKSTNPDLTEEEAIPKWARDLVEPQNDEERRYDINEDGLLQTAEVKVYLRAIIRRVAERAYVNATTDILREYDKNKDGVINSYEVDLIKEHVN